MMFADGCISCWMRAQSTREPLVRRARTGSRRGTNLRVEADEPAVGGARRATTNIISLL